jgi:putative ABC transport system substrate-binding protein
MSSLSRRHFIGLAAAAAGLAVSARPALATAAPHRIAVVQWRGDTDVDRGLRDYLARAGLPVEYTVHNAAQDRDALAAIVREVKAARPDVVYAFSTEGALGVAGPVGGDAERFITDIPVVFAAVGDPASAKLVHGMPLSGRNVTGVIHLAPITVQFEALSSLFAPRRLAVLYNDAETYGRGAVAELRKVAKAAGVELIVESPTDAEGRPQIELIGPALDRLAAAKPDALYLPSTSFFIPLAEMLTEAAVARRLPTFSANEPMIRRGKAMAGLVSSFYEVGQFTGYKVEQILVGGKAPAEVPIEALSRFSLLINMAAARELAVYPPITMLRYAEVIHGR